jgi:EAL domain-containing protein (putative c-di-GMP-specific phosphodiesterase class I)
MLRKMKCDSLQGYVVAKPMVFNEFKSFAIGNFQGQSCPDPMSI